jgi:hypothetical protein
LSVAEEKLAAAHKGSEQLRASLSQEEEANAELLAQVAKLEYQATATKAAGFGSGSGSDTASREVEQRDITTDAAEGDAEAMAGSVVAAGSMPAGLCMLGVT